LQAKQSQQLDEYAKNGHNLYFGLQQYDPELADHILQSTSFSQISIKIIGQTQKKPKNLIDDTIPFMYEVSTRARSESASHSSQIIYAPNSKFKAPKDKSEGATHP
jgi:hypothetical protein